MNENEIGTGVVESAIALHRELGPGLLESVYEVVLARILTDRGLQIERQVPVAVHCFGLTFNQGFRVDLLIEGKVVIELKAVEAVQPVHLKQLQTYLRLSDCRLGYLLNFNEALMRNGITRTVNRLEEN